MTTKPPSIQCVLLVDTYQPHNTNDIAISNKKRALALSSFRILNKFQTCMPLTDGSPGKSRMKHDDGVKWSYKFFSSRSYKSASKQEKLREFKLRYFEQYESKLEEKIKNSHEKVGKMYPSECLQKALTEIVTDIEWVPLDIASPMKGRRRIRQQHPQSTNKNFVILFTDVPTNSQEMRNFAGKRVLDSDILLDSILPPHLHDQFCNHAKLSLIWINTSCFTTPLKTLEETIEVQCLEIVTQTLQSIGGSVFNITSLLKLDECGKLSLGKFSQNDSNSLAKPTELSRNPLPFLLPSDTIVENLIPVDAKHSNHEPEHSQTSKALLRIIVDGQAQNVPLQLVPTSSMSSDQNGSVYGMDESSQREISVAGLKLVSLPDGSTESTSLTVLQDRQHHPLSRNLVLNIRNSMCKSARHVWNNVIACYHVSGHNQGQTTHSGIFAELLQELIKQNTLLILSVRSNMDCCPYLGVLEALSGSSAMLSISALGSTLALEKASLAENEAVDVKSEEETTVTRTKADIDSVCGKESSSLKTKIATGLSARKTSKNERPSRCYDPQVLNSWHLPGTSQGLPALISKLNSRLNELSFLSVDERSTLKALQKMYRTQGQPQALLQRSQPPSSQHNTENQCEAETEKGGNSKLNRGMLMVKRSKAAVKRRSKTEEEVSSTQAGKQTDKAQVNATHLDLQTEASLCQYLREVYDSAVDAGDGLETAVQNMVTVTLHFVKEKGDADSSQPHAIELLRKEMIISSRDLREKYSNRTSDVDKSMKITEYKLQVLLLLEMESAVLAPDESQVEKCVDEIVNLLRTLSFLTDTSTVPTFLNKVIVASYAPTLPQLLVSVYDELMQPLPDVLAMFASPNKSADSSVLNSSIKSPGSAFSMGSQPDSNKSDILSSQRNLRARRLVQHPSLSDYGSKKQIMVMKKPATAKQKEKAKEKEKIKKQKSAQPSTKQRKSSKAKPEIVKVRRNLFEGDNPKLERRQSVAIMERMGKSPRKKLTDASFRSPKASKSPSAKRRSVAETPAHKQMSNSVWSRQEKKRKRTHTEEDVDVVMESPMKQMEDNFKKVSPSRNKHAMNMMRRSFYSAGPRNRSRNLTKYFQFADKIAGRQQRLSLGEEPSTQRRTLPPKSPSRSSFLMSQLMGSPSPRHKTPSKRSNATTPKRVQDSPFTNTRSKTPRKFSKVLLFDSPKKSDVSSLPASPSRQRTPKKQTSHSANVLCLESPARVTRSQTPNKSRPSFQEDSKPSSSAIHIPTTPKRTPHRALSFHEDSKPSSSAIHIPTTPKRTPHRSSATPSILSPPVAPVTPSRSILKSSQTSTSKRLFELPSTPLRTPKLKFVQESPSQNTRSKIPTPSRTSVCTALFSPSSRASPRLFNLTEETRSPRRRVHFGDAEEQTSQVSETSTANDNIVTPEKSSCVTNLSFISKDGSVTSLCVKSSTSKLEGKPDVERTPSPQKQPRVKTPESFDKWPRRKRRWTSPNQCKTQKENVQAESCDTKQPEQNYEVECKNNSPELKRKVNVSRKRSFLESVQDSSTVFSQNKRSKTLWTESLSEKDMLDTRYSLHQRVSQLTPSQHTPSVTTSHTSDMDYFSPNSDEVFLKGQGQDLSHGQLSGFQSQSSFSQSLSCSSQGQPSLSENIHSLSQPIMKTVDASKSARSESPVFGASPNITRLQHSQNSAASPASQGFEMHSDEEPTPSPTFKTSPVMCPKSPKQTATCAKPSPSKFMSPDEKGIQSTSRTPPSVNKSPLTRSLTSPVHDRKFSPSVSARSLVHLMNSPLIKPELGPMSSPGKLMNAVDRSHFKSRKSLNMQK